MSNAFFTTYDSIEIPANLTEDQSALLSRADRLVNSLKASEKPSMYRLIFNNLLEAKAAVKEADDSALQNRGWEALHGAEETLTKAAANRAAGRPPFAS